MIKFKHLDGGLHIVMVLASGCQFFSAKCDQFPLAFLK